MSKRTLAKNKGKSSISLCMIVKNEEHCLGRCLKSVCDNVDEIIVVDTGSTDRTLEIAKSYGARIYHHPWENDFSKHRNQSLSYATGSWIFQLDADEELFPEDGSALRDVVRREKADYYHCRFYDMEKDDSIHGVFYLTRLFRNGMGMRYARKVHNQLQVRGKEAFSAIRIRHYGYDLTHEQMEAKHIRTTNLLKEMLEINPEDAYSLHQLASSYSMHREFDKAVKYGEMALKIMHRSGLKNAFFITTFYTVARGYQVQERLDDAERVCLKALDFFPMHIDACHILASIYFRKRDVDGCKAVSQRYLSIYEELEKNPSLIGHFYFHSFSKRNEIFFGLACVHFFEKDFETADAFFRKAFEDSGRPMEKAESICHFYFEQGMNEKALLWLTMSHEAGIRKERIPDILQNKKNLYLKIGQNYIETGNLNAAMDCLQKAIDECLTRDEQIEKRFAEVRLALMKGEIDDLMKNLESLMLLLGLSTSRCLNSTEDLGQIVYDIAEEFCHRKQWHVAAPALRLAIQIAPAIFDHNKFNNLLPVAEQR
ncbi:MAG: tetratricopeptide repeat-containing glycosyltransferase family 2 protein [Syntrophales bacterium]